MASVREHYDDHLGPIYGWMIGDFETAKDAARADLRAAGVFEGARGRAIDLGSGPGLHAIALAEAGYAVTAIDTCKPLLDELQGRAADLTIRCIHDDLLHVAKHCEAGVDAIACMGDTLTHLPSSASVERLFDAIAEILSPHGVFVATFRDYSRVPQSDADRFICVRRDDRRILTCALEYSERTVSVHDLVHERTADGWSFRVSGYEKLRLSPSWVQSLSRRVGLAPVIETTRNGMIRLVAARAAHVLYCGR